MYDVFEFSNKVKGKVCEGNKRKYYRFRYSKFYGGIATADCIGCNLFCFYCWSQNKIHNYNIGRFYSPEEVANKLIEIAKRKNCKKLRISGGEPTICFNHLVEVLKKIPNNYLFILETNGILLSIEENVKQLKSFKNLHVRVSLKGPLSIYEKVTLASKEAFYLQLKCIENLKKHKISHHVAIMVELYSKKELEEAIKMVKDVSSCYIEEELLIKYPFVYKKAKERGIVLQ